MIVALVCAGSWSSLFKAAQPYRYELFNFDVAIGVVLLSAVTALALGAVNPSELSVEDNLLITGYRLMAWAVAAGVVFNLGNAILLAAISVGGIAVSVPVALGVALIIDTALDFIADPRINPLLLFGGVAVVLIAVVVFIVTYFRHRQVVAAETKLPAFQLDPRSKEAKKKPKTVDPGAVAGLAIVGGIILAFPPRLLSLAHQGDIGLAPYTLLVLFGAGVFLSGLLYLPFLLTFPVGGSPATIADYFRAGFKRHLLGILGGMTLCGGMLAWNLVLGSPARAALGSFLYAALLMAAPLLAVLWGAFVWKEVRSSGFLWSGFLLYAVGIALIAFAPEYGAR